jgi:hypothetical protein
VRLPTSLSNRFSGPEWKWNCRAGDQRSMLFIVLSSY